MQHPKETTTTEQEAPLEELLSFLDDLIDAATMRENESDAALALRSIAW